MRYRISPEPVLHLYLIVGDSVTKVKQRRAIAGRTDGQAGARSGGAKPRRNKASAARKAPKATPRKNAKRGVRHSGKSDSRGRSRAMNDDSPRTVRLRELDPRAKCGPGTSVERLFRVDETVKGTSIAHLVFFDRHGLYCEHGRSCPAVDDVRRAHRNLDWTRKVG